MGCFDVLSSSGSLLSLPLGGRCILTTRPRTAWDDGDESDVLDQRLRDWGACVRSVPLVEIRPVSVNPALWAEPFDWLFFTSRNAVRAFFELNETSAFRNAPLLGAVGPATAAELARHGREAAFISPRFEAAETAHAFREAYPCAGLRIGWPCGNLAHPRFMEILREGGASVTPLTVYETALRRTLSPQEHALLALPTDMLVFTSSSAVLAFSDLNIALFAGDSGAAAIACLGPQTARTARERLGRVDVEANPHTLEALADAIRQYFLR